MPYLTQVRMRGRRAVGIAFAAGGIGWVGAAVASRSAEAGGVGNTCGWCVDGSTGLLVNRRFRREQRLGRAARLCPALAVIQGPNRRVVAAIYTGVVGDFRSQACLLIRGQR